MQFHLQVTLVSHFQAVLYETENFRLIGYGSDARCFIQTFHFGALIDIFTKCREKKKSMFNIDIK